MSCVCVCMYTVCVSVCVCVCVGVCVCVRVCESVSVRASVCKAISATVNYFCHCKISVTVTVVQEQGLYLSGACLNERCCAITHIPVHVVVTMTPTDERHRPTSTVSDGPCSSNVRRGRSPMRAVSTPVASSGATHQSSRGVSRRSHHPDHGVTVADDGERMRMVRRRCAAVVVSTSCRDDGR
jgi:hypothetical protein